MYDDSSIDEIPGDVGEMENLSACRLLHVSVNRVLNSRYLDVLESKNVQFSDVF